MSAVFAILLLAVGSPYRPLPSESGSAAPQRMKSNTDEAKMSERGVSNLPYAHGRKFATLDAYLKHLESNGAVDLPWWREISPGVYEHVKRMPGADREIATRAELAERFGFPE